MPAGHNKDNRDASPDKTPVMQYNVKVTQRDMNEIHHLVKRGYSGLTIAWTPAMIAVIKVLNQLSKQDEDLDNYDNDGAIPDPKSPEPDDID